MWVEAVIARLFVMASGCPRTSLNSSPIWALVSSSWGQVLLEPPQGLFELLSDFFALLLELLCDDSKHLFDH